MKNPKLQSVGRSLNQERVVLVGGFLGIEHRYGTELLREVASLCETAGTKVVGEITQRMSRPHARTFIGKGKVAELIELIESSEADAVVFHCDLTGAQLRNLEEATKVKVIDRTELILDIFASRARTKQAKLQVELAQLEYSLPRLKRMWKHLSRYEGGIGTRGPGEKQLEEDKRIIRDRIYRLRQDLKVVDEHTRRVINSRKESMCVSIVGYTNAGKSTLFNALTGADVLVESRLFATLDTKTRKLEIDGGREILLSDTVGFIRNLPHHLVASFHATLEEAITADLLLHVVDISHPEPERMIKAVNEVLKQIGCDEKPIILVLNKIDCLLETPPEEENTVAISAKTGVGLDDLRKAIADFIGGGERDVRVSLSVADGQLLARMNRDADITSQSYRGERVIVSARIKNALWEKLKKENRGSGMRILKE